MSYITTHAATRETRDAVHAGWFSGRVAPKFMVFTAGQWSNVDVVRWELLDASTGDVRGFDAWLPCSHAIAAFRHMNAGGREWVAYGTDAAGVRRAFVTWRRPFREDKFFTSTQHGHLNLGELPIGKFSKKLGHFAAVRVWEVEK